MRIWRQFMKNGTKLVQNWSNFAQKQYFWSWATFFKKNLFFENNKVQRSTKNFYEKFRPFPAIIKIHHFLTILTSFFAFSSNMADSADVAGRSADMIIFKTSGHRFSLQKNLQSRTIPSSCWDIFKKIRVVLEPKCNKIVRIGGIL